MIESSAYHRQQAFLQEALAPSSHMETLDTQYWSVRRGVHSQGLTIQVDPFLGTTTSVPI